MTGLDDKQRKDLARVVSSARRILFDDAERRLRGAYGILPDGTVQAEDQLSQAPAIRAQRRTLEAVLDHLRANGASGRAAVERLTREVAFTHLNRLLAIRVADALGVLAPSLRDGRESAGFKPWVSDLAPLLATADDTGGYWTYLGQCADELAVDAPALFDPRNPLLALRPSRAALDDVVALLADDTNAALWDADDTFGWAYQFFNTRDERQEMRKSSAPRDSRELAVRNQFFTPSYVVRFLVQNTLGRRIVDADPSTPLLDQLPLLIDPPTEAGASIDLATVKVLDPACGSGHFLLGCYDILEAAWSLGGVSPADAASRIVPCLWGVDIDPRAVQVAQAAIVFRARRACGRAPLPPANIVTARSLPEDQGAWERAQSGLAPELKALIGAMRATLRDASLLGTLVKAEQRLARHIRTTVVIADNKANDLFAAAGIAHDAFGEAERSVIAALQRVADETTATPAERLLAAGASDAVRLVEAVRNRYDVVLMNPPFGLAVPETEAYLQTAYPTSWTELYACFMLRAIELLRPHGYSGSITSNQYFSTRRLRSLRQLLVESHRPLVVMDLGPGVLHDAAVSTCVQVIPRARSAGDTVYLDLAGLTPRDQAKRLNESLTDVHHVDMGGFLSVDGLPFAFHVDRDQLGAWATSSDRFEPDVAIVRTGGKTFDNFRFVRCRWEVDAQVIGKDWLGYQKGGEYRPYWSSSHLVVNWKNDGSEQKALGVERGVLPQVMQSSAHWRLPALSYSRANKMLGVRILPAGEIFAEKSIAVFPAESQLLLPVLALLNSAPAGALVDTFGRSRFIENGAIKRLPIGRRDALAMAGLNADCLGLINIARDDEAFDETSAQFGGFSIDLDEWSSWCEAARSRAEGVQRNIDAAVAEVISSQATGDYETRLQDLVGGMVATPTQDEWAQRFVSYLVGVAFGRWDATSVPAPRPTATLTELLEPQPRLPPAGRHSAAGAHLHSLLIDEGGSARDIVPRVEAAAAAMKGGDQLLEQAVAWLKEKSLASYIRRRLFKDHLARYSKSRRQAPLYWQIALPSNLWSAWVYAPLFSRETLYGLLGAVEARIAAAHRRINAVTGAGHQITRELIQEIDAERQLLGEAEDLRRDLGRLAGSRWEPDLDDGFVLCAAPLARWFPKGTWKQLPDQQAAIKRGEYAWASIHHFREAV